jgi:hypothetical protein
MAVSVLPLLWNRIPPYRYAGIRAMAAVLPDDVRRETIARVIADGEIKRPYIDDIERARVLVELARVTPPGEERTRILTRVHAAVVEQGSWYSWVPIFRELLPLLDAGDRQTAVAAAIRMAIRSTRRDSDVETLLAIVNMLRGEELGHALEQARGLAEPGHRATFVAAVLRLACTLPVPERTAAVTIDPELLLIPDVGRGDLCTVLAAAAWRMNGELGPAGTTEVIDALKAVRKWW